MEIRTGTLNFKSAILHGTRHTSETFNFITPVRTATAVIIGFTTGFNENIQLSDLVDLKLETGPLFNFDAYYRYLSFDPVFDVASANIFHTFSRIILKVDTIIDDDVVLVKGELGIKDKDENWDDVYEGDIQFLLFVDLEHQTPSNLSITDIELNQSIQYFRSNLDPNRIHLNNSIPMISNKDTFLRIYTDTQANPARPTITDISGELIVRQQNGTETIINPMNGPILPIKDHEIDRLNQDSTLNFQIPGNLSQDLINISVRIFDSSNPNTPGFTSGTHRRSIRFSEVIPTTVHIIRINYTGNGLDLPAPSILDSQNHPNWALRVFPFSRINTTGFEILRYDGIWQPDDPATRQNEGHTGWFSLLEWILGIKDDDPDIYYAVLPPNMPSYAFGWAGIGSSAGVGGGFINNDKIFAHELGHISGLPHSPGGSPDNPDPNYPRYTGMPLGSIGEIGFNGNTIDPSTFFDIMSYSTPYWISPYTYEKFINNISNSAMIYHIDENQNRKPLLLEQLFLMFRIYRGGIVELHPSFHFLSRLTKRIGINGTYSPYVIEFRNCHNKPIQSQRVPLLNPYHNLDGPWIESEIVLPFSNEVCRIVFTCNTESCNGDEIYSVDVPKSAPKCKAFNVNITDNIGTLGWQFEGDNGFDCFYYKLRYSNNDGRSWRTISPILTKNYYVVDFSTLPGGEKCKLKILASSGIRTGFCESEPFEISKKPRVIDVKMYIEDPFRPISIPIFQNNHHSYNVIHTQKIKLITSVFSPDFGHVEADTIEWNSNKDGILGRGYEIATDKLTVGKHIIHIKAPNGLRAFIETKITINVLPFDKNFVNKFMVKR